ncbi:putative 5'-nucleotidase [Operophtera brumata]|uniref:Putative 5'-nucleotidase n=1 Tax=Operophtera brumata TaxID=104452 RepID=A0A0L7KSP8_OPEBR|nr:putative 5'-nucleotidase [Operophtera brumata]
MCLEIGMAIQNHFAAINVRTGKARPSKHRQSLVTLSRRYTHYNMCLEIGMAIQNHFATINVRTGKSPPPSTASRSSRSVEGTRPANYASFDGLLRTRPPLHVQWTLCKIVSQKRQSSRNRVDIMACLNHQRNYEIKSS